MKVLPKKLKNINLLADSCCAALDLNQIKVRQWSRGMKDLNKQYESKYLAYEAIGNSFSTVYGFVYMEISALRLNKENLLYTSN